MNQRIILIIVIAFSMLATILFNNVYAEKTWFDARNFYKEINKMDMFDKYPYDSPIVTVRIINVGEYEVDSDFIITYGSYSEYVKAKEFKDDDKAKVTFNLENGKKRVCVLEIDDGDGTELCKKFVAHDNDNPVNFYIK